MNPPEQTGRSSGGAPFWEPPSPEELSGMLPAYEVECLLGRGGMGAVYRAKQRSLKRAVAIKVLPRSAADDELKFAERFRHEAETLARLNHPGIVHIHDFGETPDGLLYLVMEYVDGTDVHRLIQSSGRLSEEHALAVTAHVCDALDYAHSRGIVHRDIKPANVLIDQEGNVKVADFGLAKMVDPQYDSGLTMSNVALGTPDYVAPEVLSYGMEVDHRADLYAVGVMLYQMLTGELPRGLFKLPSQKHHEIDPRIDGVICRALEPDREDRYQSAVEVRAELFEISTGRLARMEEASLVVPTPRARVRRLRRLAVLAGLAILLVAGILGGTIWLGPGAAPVPAPPAETDLLKDVDLKRDVVAGTWFWDPGGLKTLGTGIVPGARGGYPRVEFAQVPPPEYDFEVEFTADTDEQDAGLVFPIGGKQTAVIMNIHGGTGYVAGLSGVGGAPMHVRLTHNGRPTPYFRKGQRDVALVEVRKDRVTTKINGEVIEEWPVTSGFVNGLDLGSDFTLNDPAKLGIMAGPLTPITFHRVVVRGAGQEGRRDELAPSSPVADSAPSEGEGAPIDWLSASPSIVGKWAPEWNMRDGVATVTKDDLNMQLGKLENGFVRLKMGLAPGHGYAGQDGPMMQLDLRSGPVEGKPDRTGHYQFQVRLPNRVCSLHFQEKDAQTGKGDPVEVLWTGKALRVGDLPDEEVEWVFRADGDRIIATADGVEVCSVRDDRVASGYCMITADSGTRIRKLETTGVIPTRPGLSKPESETVPTDKDYAWTDVIAGKEWNPPWQVESGALRATEKNQTRYLGVHRNGAVRVKLRHLPDKEISGYHPLFSLTIRGKRESGGSYQFQIVPQRKISNLLFLPEDPSTGQPGAPHFLWENRPLVAAGNELELEFVAKGNRLSLWSGGKEIAGIEDSRSPTGSWIAIISPGVEILDLSLGLPAAAESSLPGITWTDVTARVREEAAKIPKLSVEEEGIRRIGEGSPVAIPITDPSWRNYAVRVRHTGGAQINLRSSEENGFVYALCQGTQSLLQRWDIPKLENLILAPAVPHPSGYDNAAPHEFIAIVEDNLFRTWVDGVLAGQARDSALAKGVGSVMWVKGSMVHSVEVSQLPDPVHPKLDKGFWGQVSRVNAERQVEIVEAALESINGNDLSLKATFEGRKLVLLNITKQDGNPLHDLSPVSALTDLKTLFCYAPGVRDLDWLRGMAIENLQLTHAEVENLDVLRETKITYLTLGTPDKPPRTYDVLAGLPIRSLNLKDCPIKDLSFLSDMPLDRLVLAGTGITDYTPLKAFPLVEVDVDLVPERDLPILLAIPTLKKINGKPVEEYRVGQKSTAPPRP